MKLTNENIKWIAGQIGCQPEMVDAVYRVESKRDPFDADGFPTILYERHIFYKNAPASKRDLWQQQHPDLCNEAVTPRGGYGPFAGQRSKLSRAMSLDADAALEACSWGAFQELGENWKMLGFSSVGEMVDTMKDGLRGQADVFIRSIRGRKLVTAMKTRDFDLIALRYNGRAYKKAGYHISLRTAYNDSVKRNIDWASIASTRPENAKVKPSIQKIKESPVPGGNLVDEPITTKVSSSKTSETEDGVETKTVQQTISSPKEKIAIEKPPPSNLWSKLWKKIVAAVTTNGAYEVISSNLERTQTLGLTPAQWTWIGYIVLGGTFIALMAYIYNEHKDKRREESITRDLMNANSTGGNFVQLIEPELIETYRARGYKIITR